MPRKIGFIGLGHLGSGMAGVLAEDGHEMHALDTNPECLARAVARGMIRETTPKDVAAASEVLFTCLPQSDVVTEVCLGKNGVIEGGRRGLLVIDCTSGYQPQTLKIAAALAEKGIRMIDAPVTGGEGGGGSIAAPKRGLTMIVGGAEADVKEAWPLLQSLSKHLYPVGPLGHGHVVKAINNTIAFASRLVTFEGFLVAAKYGIDPATVANVLVNGTGLTGAAVRVAQTGSAKPDSKRPGGFSIGLMTKDLRHMTKLAVETGVPTFVGDQAFHLAELITRKIGYDADIQESTRVLEEWAGVTLK